MKRFLLIVILLMSRNIVFGAVNSGTELLQKCDAYISYMGNKKITDNNFAHDMGICAGYIDGAVYTHNVTRSGSPIWCLPNNVNSDQIIRVVVNHLRENPDELNKNPGVLMLVAMVNAYPCPE
jgi:hypothetical protein